VDWLPARQEPLLRGLKLLPLAYLARDLTEAILDGRQPQALSLGALTAKPLPIDWAEQRRLFAAIG